MSQFRVAGLVLTLLTLPARADDSEPVETIWSLFTDHCTKFLEADTLKDIAAAFSPHKLKFYTTPDGALLNGASVFEDLPLPDTPYLLFNVSITRLDGGVMRSCLLPIAGEQTALDGLTAHAQKNAADVLGNDAVVKGGPIITNKGLVGSTLYISSPGFPPKKSIYVISGKHITSLAMSSIEAE